MNQHDTNGRTAVQHLTMMFGVIAGGLGIAATIVAIAWYGGTMASRIEYQGKQIDALEFRTKVLENKVSRTGS